MGRSAKITRGGNKTRINEGRKEAKLKAMGAKKHSAAGGSAGASSAGKLGMKKTRQQMTSQAIATQLKAQNVASRNTQNSNEGSAQQSHAIVKMAPKPQPKRTAPPAPAKQNTSSDSANEV